MATTMDDSSGGGGDAASHYYHCSNLFLLLAPLMSFSISTRRYAPADGSSTRGGSTSVSGRVRSPYMAKLQAASVPIA